MKNILYVILVSLFSLTVISCTKKSSDISSSIISVRESSDISSSTTKEIEGTWVTNCNTATWNKQHYVIETITVSGSAFLWKWDEYFDSSCSDVYMIWTNKYSSLSLTNGVTFDDGIKGSQFTMNVDSQEGLMKTEAAVTDYNNWNWCGFSDWVLNTAKDYSGKKCGNNESYPARNATVNGVYKLDESSLLITKDSTTSVGSTVFIKQ